MSDRLERLAVTVVVVEPGATNTQRCRFGHDQTSSAMHDSGTSVALEKVRGPWILVRLRLGHRADTPTSAIHSTPDVDRAPTNIAS